MHPNSDAMPDARVVSAGLAEPPAVIDDMTPTTSLPDIPVVLGPPRHAVPGEVRQAEAQGQARPVKEHAESSTIALIENYEELTSKYPRGTLRVERMGPAGIPQSELGDVGKIKLADLGIGENGKGVEELLHEKFGGGEYRLALYASNGRPARGVDDTIVSIAGEFKPQSAEGQSWLDAKRRSGGSAMTEALQLADRLTAKSGQGDLAAAMTAAMAPMATVMNGLLTTLAANRNDAADARKHELELERLRSERLDKERADAARRAADELASKERIAKAESDAKIEQERVRAEAKADRVLAFAHVKAGVLTSKYQMQTRLRETELAQAGPLGIDGAKMLRSRVVEGLVERAMKTYGLDVAPPEEEQGGLVMKFLSEHGDKVLDIGGKLLGHLMQPPAGAASAGSVPPGSPAPAALPQPEATVDVSNAGDPTPSADPAKADIAPTPAIDAAPDAVQQLAITDSGLVVPRVSVFLRSMLRELLTDSDPATAWDADADKNGPDREARTIEQLFNRLAGAYRRALPDGWVTFRGVLPAEHAPELVAALDRAMEHPDAVTWMTEFVDCGPWNEDEEDEELAP